jgi:putative glutamine amidotransferase
MQRTHLPVRPIIGIPVGQGTNPRGAKLYTVHQLYLNAIYKAGGIPCPVPLHLDEDIYQEIFQRLNGLLLAGGEDIDPQFYGDEPKEAIEKTDPDRDRVELLLARWAVDARMPILGICRGHQLLNVAMGGALYQDIHDEMGVEEVHDMRGKGEGFRQKRPHQVILDPESKIARELGAVLWVNSLHHQAVARPGKRMKVVGTSPGGVIEAMELEDHPFAVTVQWHPEMLADDELMQRVFNLFIEEATRYRTEIRSRT